MNNLNKFRKSTVAILTALLIIAIAAPLVSFAVAAGAPTASLDITSGLNGTVITVSGTGYGGPESVGAGTLFVSIDGQAAGTNVITTTKGAVAGTNPATTITVADQLQTSATGVLSGKIILYGLPVGPHTISIYDSTTSQVAGTFTITTPTVSVTPSTVAAGSSVTVTGSGFPVSASAYYTNVIYQSTFSAASITVVSGSTTATVTELSSNVITATGTYIGTVSLPAVTPASGSAFTLKDAFGNVATQTLSTGTPVVTLSPASGPVGTAVTATLTGFGPTATISSVVVGNIAASTSAATFAPAVTTVTEQGTAVVAFAMPAGTTTTKAGAAGSQTIKVTDSLGNVGTATFTITPQVTLALGDTVSGSSGTTYAPASTSSKLFIVASGLKASTALTITASPNTPTAWITPTAAWTVTTGAYSATTGKISTNANGQVDVVSILGTSPAAAGQYSVTISDGTNSISTILTITTTGNIIAVSPASGAKGSTVTVTYFGATPANIYFDGTSVATPTAATHETWPLVAANQETFTVSATASAGLHTVSAGASFNSAGYTVATTSVTTVNPASASVGTTVTMVGTGYSGATAALSMQGASVAADTDDLVGQTLIATFTIPNYLPGAYTLSLSDGTNSASSTLNVASPSIQITPTTSTLGTATIAITGSGFAAGELITVNFDTTTITATTPVGLTVFNSNGGILLLSGYDIPTSTTAGTHTVTVLGASGAYAQTTFTVQPSLTALTAVRPGAKITITGTGFAANSLQTLTVNGTATTWMNLAGATAVAFAPQSTVVTGATGDLYTTSAAGFVVSTTQAAGTLVVVVTDASGNTASTELIVLPTQTITLGASQIIAGTIATGVTISGEGFTPGSRSMSAKLYQGTTEVATATLTGSPVTVLANGTFQSTALSFKIPAGTVAGQYTLKLTATTPTETAEATLTVLSAPTAVAPTTAASGSNVTLTVTGLSSITAATYGATNLITSSLFGPTTVASTGADAFTTTTWFIVPTTAFAGTYLLTLTDASTGLSVQKAIAVTPTITLAPTIGIKGATVTITGTGFAASSTVTATFNGVAITLSASGTTAAGGITPTFTVPITAAATNTVVVTDAAGNIASATFTLSNPTLTANPETAAVGSTVQLLGSGFTAGSAIVVQAGSQIITTVPATITATGGSFIAYFTVPTGLSGNVTVTATDTTNNVATTYLTVTTSTGGSTVPSQTTMTSTAQTTTTSGTATTTFTAGSTVKAGFMLQSTSGSRDVVVAVTWQQGAKVYNMASFQTTMTTTASAVSFSNSIPAGATGTWTATLQVFASDGTTPLAVTTLTFTVS